MLSMSLLLRRVSRYLHHTASFTTSLPSRYTDQNNKPSSATMRNEMNCAVMTKAIFLSLEPLRSARHVRHTTSPLHSDGDTTHNWELKTKGKLRSTSAHCADCATTRRTAHEVRRSRDTDIQVSTGTCHVTENRQILHSAWFSKHTTRQRIHTCAYLKHSNFLNTDRMRKPGLSNCCSHETLLHFGLQQLSQERVKQLPSNSNLKTGTRALNLVEHLCLLGSTNSCPTNQD